MAAVLLWSKISLCPRASSALYGHQNITTFTKIVYRQYVSRVVQSATFMMKQEGELPLKFIILGPGHLGRLALPVN